MTTYNHETIEKLWKDKWYADNIYEAVDFSDKPKKYILAELPYPSGKALHIGHAMRYTVPEVYSRYLRMKGYNVMFPMGWDAFGLPTEGYAIKENKTPQEVMDELAVSYRLAMQDMGYAIDWNREISTCDPRYYKWTQWLFLKFYEQGLAELKEMPVWWCKELGNLADEEVLTDKDGNKISERGGHKVERKLFRQWVLKMPKYADKLLDGLKDVDFTDAIKNSQINWIGKSEGIVITYDIEGTNEKVVAFTTRPDTNFGATFIVLTPEHPLVNKITTLEHAEKVTGYAQWAKNQSDLERMTAKKKTGEFTGAYAINNLNGKKLPIYVADYVLISVGTGAVIGVPGHDKRDFEFAKAMQLPVVRVVVGKDGDSSEITKLEQVQEESGTMTNSEFLDGLNIHEATKKIMDYLEQKGWGKRTVTYKLRDWVFSRQRYWGEPIPVIYKQDGTTEAIVTTTDKIGVDENLPVTLPLTKDYQPKSDGTSPLSKLAEFVNTIDSKGKPATRETQTMPTWAGSNWYFIRYIDPNNSETFADFAKMKYWLPVDRYFGGAEHTTVHLLYSRFWFRFFYDLGLVPYAEPYMWRINGGLMLGTDGRKMSKRWGNVVEPGELVKKYGADATRLAICFIGPYDETYPWNDGIIRTMHKFIAVLYKLQEKVSVENESNAAVLKAFNKMLKNVTHMCENLKMNTAISELMVFANELKKVDHINKGSWLEFCKVLAPFAPFVAEDMWQKANGFNKWQKENSVHLQNWPSYDERLTQETELTIPVQINGKVRAEVNVALGDTAESVKTKVLELPKVKASLNNATIDKYFYKEGKIVSIVTTNV